MLCKDLPTINNYKTSHDTNNSVANLSVKLSTCTVHQQLQLQPTDMESMRLFIPVLLGQVRPQQQEASAVAMPLFTNRCTPGRSAIRHSPPTATAEYILMEWNNLTPAINQLLSSLFAAAGHLALSMYDH